MKFILGEEKTIAINMSFDKVIWVYIKEMFCK